MQVIKSRIPVSTICLGLLALMLSASTGCKTVGSADAELLKQGYAALGAHQLNQAMSIATDVLSRNPGETVPAEAYYLRGRVYEEYAISQTTNVAANLQNARTEYSNAMGLPHRPDLDGRIRAGAANVAFHQDDFVTAQQQWSAAYEELERPEDKILTMYQLGRTSQRLGNWAEADRYLDLVQQSAPDTDLAAKAKLIQGVRGFTLQVATYSNATQAQNALSDIRKQGLAAQTITDPQYSSHILLRIANIQTYSDAKTMKSRLAASFPNAIIMP